MIIQAGEQLGEDVMNEYHAALLLRVLNAQESAKVREAREEGSERTEASRTSLEMSGDEIEALVRSHDAVPLQKKRHSDRSVMASLAQLVACRLQEGYHISSIDVSKGDTL